jgi:hypothetical protein
MKGSFDDLLLKNGRKKGIGIYSRETAGFIVEKKKGPKRGLKYIKI